MVVGDDCQSIYGFRGAEYRNILAAFEQVTLGGEEINLEIKVGGTTEMDRAALERLVKRLRGR